MPKRCMVGMVGMSISSYSLMSSQGPQAAIEINCDIKLVAMHVMYSTQCWSTIWEDITAA